MQVTNSDGNPVGTFDGETVKGLDGQKLFQVKSNQIYTTEFPSRLVGELDHDVALDIWGNFMFNVSDDKL
ncbi:hypothetical protein L3Q72_09305 [Vibrio sp. JC009]|uniref:hypothetical protein n=1 Tax=Vibrio sp. JC009 TaxID=2912314 RepID=UPI0023AF57E3|nr:hypothetical protein [Vibrio sp. JC009]WED20840.1 hypothetical protein L3Q72_09305 [Vibrio sp. JC009]